MSIAAIIIALVLAFIAFRFVAGVLKFVVIGAVLIAIAWYFMHGGAA